MSASVRKLSAIVPAAALLGLLVAGGCDRRDSEVRSYSAPKDPAPATAPVAAEAMDARPVGPHAAGQAQSQAQALPHPVYLRLSSHARLHQRDARTRRLT